jgi:hypothetical protein
MRRNLFCVSPDRLCKDEFLTCVAAGVDCTEAKMIRGFSKLGQFVPKAGKLRELQRWRLMCDSKADLALMRVTAKQYSSSASIQGGVVTQVIGAVVDVQVGDWVCCCGGGGGVRKCSLYLMVVCYAV